jgi:hypothetical protein
MLNREEGYMAKHNFRVDLGVIGKLFPNSDCFITGTPLASNLTTTGLPAEIGSLCFTGDSELYHKYGTGDTQWEAIDQSKKDMLYSGFLSWAGDSGDYWSRTGNQFTVLRGGTGRISTLPVSWAGNQTITLTTNATTYVYIDGSGVLNATITPGSLYMSSIMLFEVLWDGTNAVVVRENHPYSFSGAVSVYLHNVIGTVLRATAGVLQKVGVGTGASADDRRILFTGGDVLEDHGLSTPLPASSPITWTRMYKNASGKWILYDTVSELTGSYNLGGTITAIDNKKSALYSLYVAKDNLNSSTPTYIALFDNEFFGNLDGVQNAIGVGNCEKPDNELKALEIAQIGFASVYFKDGVAYVEWVGTQKDTAGLRMAQIGSSGSHILLSEIDGGMYGDGGHSNLVGKVIASGDPTVTDDVALFRPMTMWKNYGNELFSLLDNTAGSAKWHRLTRRTTPWVTGSYFVAGERVSWNSFEFVASETHTASATIDLSKMLVMDDCYLIDVGSFALLNVVYWNGTAWALARADAESTLSEPVRVVLAVSDGKALIAGGVREVNVGTHGLTGVNYLSEVTAGALGSTKPTTGFSQAILKVKTATNVVVLNTEAVEL